MTRWRGLGDPARRSPQRAKPTLPSTPADRPRRARFSTRAYRLIRQRRTADAVTAFIESQKILDLWLARLDLGRAYEEAEHHAEALAELDRAKKRQGEATALFLDDIPTFRHLATLPYWFARAQEGLGQTQAATANYTAFLAPRRSSTDPLTVDARRRVTSP